MQAGETLSIAWSTKIDNYAYSSGIFYRSGTVETSGADPTIGFRIAANEISKAAIKNKNTSAISMTSAYIYQSVNSIDITAPDGATFTNYKFNLVFCVGDPPEAYEEPSFLKTIQSKLKSFFVEGKNRWNGATEANGVTSIDFVVESPLSEGDYTLFLDRYAEGAGGSMVEFNFSDGSVIGKTSTNGAYEFTADTPLKSFKVF